MCYRPLILKCDVSVTSLHIRPNVSDIAAQQFEVCCSEGMSMYENHQLHLTLIDFDDVSVSVVLLSVLIRKTMVTTEMCEIPYLCEQVFHIVYVVMCV